MNPGGCIRIINLLDVNSNRARGAGSRKSQGGARMCAKGIGSLAVVLLFWAQAVPAAEVPTLSAQAEMINAEGKSAGVIRFRETAVGLEITAKLERLPAGVHALHIHETGDCHPHDFKSAGGHFNPQGAKHGLLNPEGPHAGDLPNFTVGKNGRAEFTLLTKRLTLQPGEKNSLLKEGGASVMIHQDPDDYVTDPTGNSGPRIACGSIQVKTPDESK
jgi:superoxide dismutase, Cu-Zn family